MTSKVVENSWLPRSGGSGVAASMAIMSDHRTAAPCERARSPGQSAVLPETLGDAPFAVERRGVELGQFGVVHPPPQRAGVVLGLPPPLPSPDSDCGPRAAP